MDILNDYYPLYPENPDKASDSEISENNEYISKLYSINNSKKRKKNLKFDDFCLKYSDDLWYLWCIISEFTNNGNILANMEYSSFCSMCYENSVKI